MMKRTFDIVTATAALFCLLPLFAVLFIVIRFDSAGPAFFRQRRVGKGFRPFAIYKFRTMVSDAPQLGGSITVGRDPRVTRIGRLLRRTKIDEFPQLLNVLKGDMSIVGPRPEVPEYVRRFEQDYRMILSVRPGITDLASLQFRDEAAILGSAADPEDMYLRHVLPTKIELAKRYVRVSSLTVDLAIIFKTLAAVSGAAIRQSKTAV